MAAIEKAREDERVMKVREQMAVSKESIDASVVYRPRDTAYKVRCPCPCPCPRRNKEE